MKSTFLKSAKVLVIVAITSIFFTSCTKGSQLNGLDDTNIADDKGGKNKVEAGDDKRLNTMLTLPKGVPAFILTNFQGASIVKVETEIEHGVTVFKVTIEKDAVQKVVRFYSNGTSVEVGDDKGGRTKIEIGDDKGGKGSDDAAQANVVAPNSLPAKILPYILANYTGWTYVKTEKELEDSGVVYKVTIVKGDARKRLLFDANGNFLREKN